MSQKQQLLRRLEIAQPVLQAPMAGVATPELAAAVSNAGALGGLGLGAKTVDQARAAIAATQALTVKPFNVNFFCHRPAVADAGRETAWLRYLQPLFAEFGASAPARLHEMYTSFVDNRPMLDMLLVQRPAVVSFIFGLPSADWIAALRGAGIVTLGCATTVAEARQVEAAGVDAVVAQGAAAGGHRGVFQPAQGDARLSTLTLVRLIATDTSLPVIAAGGIMDGQGIAAAMQLGAAAVQMGTAFIPCRESAAKPAHREALRQGDRVTAITDVISGRPARGFVNRMHRDVAGSDRPPLPDYPFVYDAGKALAQVAGQQGNHDFDAQWAGQGASLAREMPAAELVATLVEEWRTSGA